MSVYRRIAMKKKKGLVFLILAVLAFSMYCLTGCGEEKSGNTISEPDITVDYLHGEYSDQLMTDGAVTMLGSIDVTQNGDSYSITITEKEVVPNSGYEDGYYIADTNITKEAEIGLYARMTSMVDGEEAVVDAAELMESNEAADDDDSQQLYTIYLMGDSAELILATDPASVITE